MKLFVREPADLAKVNFHIGNMAHPFTVTLTKGAPRSLEQNALIHKWFGEISRQAGDLSPAEVKAQCNLEYGKPILARDDPEWAEVYGAVLEPLVHELRLKAVRKLDIPFTREMTVKQLSEYMDQMSRDYRECGFALSDPEALRYREEMGEMS